MKNIVMLALLLVGVTLAGTAAADHIAFENAVLDRTRVAITLGSSKRKQFLATAVLDLPGGTSRVRVACKQRFNQKFANGALARIARHMNRASRTSLWLAVKAAKIRGCRYVR